MKPRFDCLQATVSDTRCSRGGGTPSFNPRERNSCPLSVLDVLKQPLPDSRNGHKMPSRRKKRLLHLRKRVSCPLRPRDVLQRSLPDGRNGHNMRMCRKNAKFQPRKRNSCPLRPRDVLPQQLPDSLNGHSMHLRWKTLRLVKQRQFPLRHRASRNAVALGTNAVSLAIVEKPAATRRKARRTVPP